MIFSFLQNINLKKIETPSQVLFLRTTKQKEALTTKYQLRNTRNYVFVIPI